MITIKGNVTVCFEDPFWVAVIETIHNGKLEASKVTFGAEPKDYEVYDFLLKNWNRLKFSPPIDSGKEEKTKINPKRLHRKIKKMVTQNQGIGTKAQQALKKQQEEIKLERKNYHRRKTLEEKARRFELRQEKKKQKHRGR